MAIAGQVGAVFLQTGDPPVVFADEPCSGDPSFTRYQIDDRDHRYWDRSAAVTVEVNDIPVSSGYELEHLGGVVVFGTALEADDVVTVLATDPSTRRDITRFCEFLGHELLADEERDGEYSFRIRKQG